MSPRQLWISSPRRTPPELLERTSVFDEDLVGRLLDRVAESAATANKHYTVLVGAAGVGKSHLLALLCHRVAQADHENDAGKRLRKVDRGPLEPRDCAHRHENGHDGNAQSECGGAA